MKKIIISTIIIGLILFCFTTFSHSVDKKIKYGLEEFPKNKIVVIVQNSYTSRIILLQNWFRNNPDKIICRADTLNNVWIIYYIDLSKMAKCKDR